MLYKLKSIRGKLRRFLTVPFGPAWNQHTLQHAYDEVDEVEKAACRLQGELRVKVLERPDTYGRIK